MRGGTDFPPKRRRPASSRQVTYWDIAKEFSLLGYIGFGGPAAHIGLFQKVGTARCKHVSWMGVVGIAVQRALS